MAQLTLSSFQKLPSSNYSGSTVILRIWYNRSFVDSDGTAVNGGPNFYKSITCTISSGVITVPSTANALFTTTDATDPNPQSIAVLARFYTRNNTQAADWVFNGNGTPDSGWVVYNPDPLTSVTYEQLVLWNQSSYLVNPPSLYWSEQQVIDYVSTLFGTQNNASDVVKGITKLSVAPLLSTNPIAIGQNVMPINVKDAAYGATGGGVTNDTAAFNLAITAAASHTLFVPAGTYLLSNLTVPATVGLELEHGAILKPVTGQTITIVGTLTADASSHFTNATSGLGTISFSGNKVVRSAHPEWWGWATTSTATVNSAAWNACNAALVTISAGEILLADGTYDINATCSLGSDAGFTGISVGGTNGLVGTVLNWTGATNTVAIYVNKGRFNHLHDFYLLNGAGAVGTSIGISFAGPAVSLQTAMTHTERVTVDGFAIGVESGHVATNSASDESLFTLTTFQNCTKGFSAESNFNSVSFSFNRCTFAANSYGIYATAGSGINLTGSGGGSNTIYDIYFSIGGAILSVEGWDSEVSNKFLFAGNRAQVTVNGAQLRGYTGVRTDREATITVDGSYVILNNVFHGGTFTGVLGPHFLYLLNGATADVTSCYFPDNELPHISPISGESNGSSLRGFINYQIDNSTNLILSHFPDTPRGQVVWTSAGYPTDLLSFSTIGSAFASGTYSPAQITGNVDNYNPGFASLYLRLNTDASRNITGMTFTTAQVDGQTHYIVNVGAQNIVLINDATSTAANRFLNTTGANITLTPNQQAMCVYDLASLRWRTSKMN